MPSLDDFTGGQRDQEAIRFLLAGYSRPLTSQFAGVVAETCDRTSVADSAQLVSGRLQSGLVLLCPGERFSRALVCATTAGEGQDVFRVGLYRAYQDGPNELLHASPNSFELAEGVCEFEFGYVHAGERGTVEPCYLGVLSVAATPPSLACRTLASPLLTAAIPGSLPLGGAHDDLQDVPGVFRPEPDPIVPWIALV